MFHMIEEFVFGMGVFQLIVKPSINFLTKDSPDLPRAGMRAKLRRRERVEHTRSADGDLTPQKLPKQKGMPVD